MNSYEAKQEAKRHRLLNAADAADSRSIQAHERADLREEKSGIPLGQPILVGHHSEKRHRAALKRSDNAMRKAISESNRADELRSRAASVGTGGISGDDPEALTKLRGKLTKLEEKQTFMKAANRIVRSLIKKGYNHESSAVDLEPLITFSADVVPLDKAELLARGIMEPDSCNRIGFASYELTNNNAKIKATQKRINQIEAVSQLKTKSENVGNICTYVENAEAVRVQFIFDGKPCEDIRTILKNHAFKWSPMNKAWQRQLNNNGRYSAQLVINKLKELVK